MSHPIIIFVWIKPDTVVGVCAFVLNFRLVAVIQLVITLNFHLNFYYSKNGIILYGNKLETHISDIYSKFLIIEIIDIILS